MSYYAHSNGTKIYYQVRGTGTPLVLLMGFGADGNTWEPHLRVYEKYFKCIVIDNRGVGKSDQPAGPYSTAMMALDTVAVMQHAGVSKAHVAGISMGGAIAQELAIHFPHMVQSVVLTSTWPAFNNYAKTVYENLKKIRVSVSAEVFMELLQLWIYAPPFYETGMQALREGQQAAGNNPNPQSRQGFEGQLDACIGHHTIDRLPQIKVPTLITVGDQDIFTPPAFSRLLHEKIPHAAYVSFPQGGHVHHWEDLDRYNDQTLQFLLNN